MLPKDLACYDQSIKDIISLFQSQFLSSVLTSIAVLATDTFCKACNIATLTTIRDALSGEDKMSTLNWEKIEENA